jgi:DNA helicase-2/ATP-dependent DNA helicase PcrA
MTLHAAKGLEFPVVFVLGVEQGLIPHERALDAHQPGEIEEERRLLFVGMTRAQQRLVLTQTRERDFRGRRLPSVPSSFLLEAGLTTRDLSAEGGHVADEWAISDHYVDDEDGLPPAGFADDEADASPAEDESEDSGAGTRLRRRKQRAGVGRPTLPPLMTAADLLRQQQTGSESPAAFGLGDAVRHPRYGVGVIVNTGGVSRRRTVTVEFDDGRRETFVAANAPLQPVGLR